MNVSKWIPIEGADCPFFFDDQPLPYYKIYHDGSHYVATMCYKKKIKQHREGHTVEAIDMLFDSLYFNGLQQGYKYERLSAFIKKGILELYPDYEDLDKFIAEKIKKKLHNIYVRKKRFRRKANLNRWNYFVTFTYDDKKQSEVSFEKKLRKCLSNLHSRRGWLYMGTFERAPITGRLHFHGVFYVPDGQMIGQIYEKTDYSTAQHKMQTAHINIFFEETFGRNDFREVDENILRKTGELEYILKYIGKTGQRIIYSRGIPSEIYKQLPDEDIACDYMDFVTKYVLFDDVIDYDGDVKPYTNKRVIPPPIIRRKPYRLWG